MKDIVQKAGLADCFEIASAATSREELGNPVHPGTRRKLAQYGISTAGKYARQMTLTDYAYFDYLIGMDDWNIRNILRITGGDPEGRICKLLSFAGKTDDIADPWYTGNFDETYRDVLEGCEAAFTKMAAQLHN